MAEKFAKQSVRRWAGSTAHGERRGKEGRGEGRGEERRGERRGEKGEYLVQQ